MAEDIANRSPNYAELESERWGEERGSLGFGVLGVGCLRMPGVGDER